MNERIPYTGPRLVVNSIVSASVSSSRLDRLHPITTTPQKNQETLTNRMEQPYNDVGKTSGVLPTASMTAG
jgi:hypothetical protein